ncbi:hypothetical protein VNO80_12874 [Phaseolus coccineus]|uniref:Uncharacterized protein n=1 Tax=Phaseolus coccineus TaxID=3886 RepID=A0AAN9N0X4_PHACN
MTATFAIVVTVAMKNMQSSHSLFVLLKENPEDSLTIPNRLSDVLLVHTLLIHALKGSDVVQYGDSLLLPGRHDLRIGVLFSKGMGSLVELHKLKDQLVEFTSSLKECWEERVEPGLGSLRSEEGGVEMEHVMMMTEVRCDWRC